MALYEASERILEAEPVRPLPSFYFLRRLARKRLAVVALVIIGVIYLAGILAPIAAPHGFAEVDFRNTFAGPSLDHPFGTDRLGRDMLSRVMWASQTTVIISAAAILTGGLALGVTLGLLAGYAGGRTDNLIMRVADAFFALPDILLLLLITATVRPRVEDFFQRFDGWPVLGGLIDQGLPDYFLIFGALSLFGWVGMARIVRSQVLVAARDGLRAGGAGGRARARRASSSATCCPTSRTWSWSPSRSRWAPSPGRRSPSPGWGSASSRRTRASAS